MWLLLALMLALAVAGCAGRKSVQQDLDQLAVTPAGSKLIVTPETRLVGRVVSFDADGQFAVLNFPIGHLPALGERLSVYRLGLKVGEIKVTGPQRDDNIVGDVVAGEARKGDEAREQ